MRTVAKPDNYDQSFGWLNKKRSGPYKMAERSLDAVNPIAKPGPSRSMAPVNKSQPWMTEIIDDPNRVPLPLGHTPSDFSTRQIPNTAPKFDSRDDLRVKPSDNKITQRAKQMITGGGQSTEKGILRPGQKPGGRSR